MAGTNRPVYYWDTCIFIAWLRNENRPNNEMDGVVEHLARFRKRELSLMTSVLTLSEISISKVPAGTDSRLEDAMQLPNFTRVSVDIRVARLARELRDYYSVRQSEFNGKTLMVPDALHLATAILYKADEFHTFDGLDKPKFNSLGLLPLSGNVGGHRLKICKPSVPPQFRLALPEPP